MRNELKIPTTTIFYQGPNHVIKEKNQIREDWKAISKVAIFQMIVFKNP